jgi:DNA-binding NarL/FixJ family response regulator
MCRTAAKGEELDAVKRIKVLIVDDHEMFTHGLELLLANQRDITVVGTAGGVADAVAAAVALEPDVILMDFELPDGDGTQATEQIKALMPSVKVIMLTAHTDDEALVRAMAAGCSGFVTKHEVVADLVSAIVAANAGEVVSPPTELVPLLRALHPTNRGLGADLTPREIEVLGLIASGIGNKELAQGLGLSVNTVRNHAQNILYKLDAHSKLEAVATAVREGIIHYPTGAADT